MKISPTNPISEVWSQWKGRDYPKTAVTGVVVYYISGYLQNLSDPVIQEALSDVLIADGLFSDGDLASEAVSVSHVFSGFVHVNGTKGKQSLRYLEPRAATPNQAAYAVTWVEVPIAD